MADDTTITPPDMTPMLAAVGEGMRAFAMVELGMAVVMQSMMWGAPKSAPMVALDAARHLETRLRIMSAVADHVLEGDDLKRARNLLNRIGRRAEMRNKLAHWTVSYWPGAASVDDAKKWKVALVPPMTSSHHSAVMWEPKSTTVRPLFHCHLEMFASSCNKLWMDLFAFANHLKPMDGADDGGEVSDGEVG